MFWTLKDLEDSSGKLVRFNDGGLFSILRDRTKKNPTYTLGDELGMIEGAPNHQGPLSERLLLAILNEGRAKFISLGDAQQVRADHRVKMKQRVDST
jgi:hypothetical protein